MKWFVEPDTVRLDLGDEQWIKVKTELTYREQKQLDAASIKQIGGLGDPDARLEVDYERVPLARMLTWIVDWSVTEGENKPVPVDMAHIEILTSGAVAKINAALDKHIVGVAAKNAVTPT